jgi:hypothetical protein
MHARRRSHGLRRRRNPSVWRRRNPSSTWGSAFVSTLIGLGTGIAAYGVNWGVEYIPATPMIRSAVFGAGGLLVSLGLAKWGSPTLGAGFGGGVGALLTGRIVTQVRMAQVAPTPAGTQGTAGAVYRMNGRNDGGAVYQRQQGRFAEAGAVFQRDAGAATMRAPVFGPPGGSFKRAVGDAGASRFVQGPVRFFGPGSWARNDGGRRYVSAHNR